MARKPRRLIIFDKCTTHKVWRAHNKEFYLHDDRVKDMYLQALRDVTASSSADAKMEKCVYELNAICIMSNHVHEIFQIDSVESFSNLMRDHHSRFGQTYNKIKGRSGAVAENRPHTTCFETSEHSMEAVFYVHANPYRVTKIKDQRLDLYSTHKLYAFGIVPKFLCKINFKFPHWYLRLGKTPAIRQRKYRQLFAAYLEREKRKDIAVFSKIDFFGSDQWVSKNKETLSSFFKDCRDRQKDSS